jgi:hypothetical protein
MVRYNRSRDGQGGKHIGNRQYATTGPPQTLRRQAQRLSRFGGRALQSMRLDADVLVDVGGDVDGRLKVTCCCRPRCDGGGAQTGGACALGQPLRGGLAGSVSIGVLGRLESGGGRPLQRLGVPSECNGPGFKCAGDTWKETSVKVRHTPVRAAGGVVCRAGPTCGPGTPRRR